MQQSIFTKSLLSSYALGAGGSVTTEALDLNQKAWNGNLALQYDIDGAGAPNVDIEYELSIDGDNFVTPSSGAALASTLLKTSGTSGNDILDITSSIEFARFIRFVVTETNSAAATVSLDVAMQ